jgi:predicted transcriptional regulator
MKLLIEEGKLSVDQIAKIIGRSKVFANKVTRGEARLSAEDLGKLTKSISKSLINKISAITMNDVKCVAENVVKKTPSATKDALKRMSKEAGAILQSAGAFLKGLGS